MGDSRRVFFLVLIIVFFTGVLVFLLDRTGVIQASDYMPGFLQKKNPVLTEDNQYPSEVDKLNFEKTEQRLNEKEEQLSKLENDLKAKEAALAQKDQEIKEIEKSLLDERTRLQRLVSEWNDRKKKIADLAVKVQNMPPDKAREMMERWPDFDVIEVLRQIDKNAAETGEDSITPYLLTLFTPAKRAELTRKMLLPPFETSENNEPVDG